MLVNCGVPQGSILGPVLFLALIHNLLASVGINPLPSLSSGTVGYVDDVVLWLSGPSVEVVKPELESTARLVASYMAANCMALNPEKTQVIWFGSGSKSPKVMVGNALVSPVESIEILSLKFGHDLKSDPHISTLISSVASLAGAARRLRIHLPAQLAKDVVRALIIGKIGYGIAAALFPRLSQDDSRPALASALQICVKDVARALCGWNRADSLLVPSLLEQTGLPSVNRLAVKSVAMETWKSLRPLGRPDVSPLASLFGLPISSSTRAGAQDLRKPATKFPVKSFINVATTKWHSNEHLRSALSVGAAKRVTSYIAEACPI